MQNSNFRIWKGCFIEAVNHVHVCVIGTRYTMTGEIKSAHCLPLLEKLSTLM